MQIGENVDQRFAALPAPVASGWLRFIGEPHETLALLLLIDCFECALKFLSILSLEIFRQHSHGQEAENIKARLSSELQMPSLGHFAGALRDCSKFIIGQNNTAWSSLLQPVCSQTSQDAIDKLLSLRNTHRGHGATLDRTFAGELVGSHLPALIGFLSTISEHPRLRLWRTLRGEAVAPVGFELPADSGESSALPPAKLLEEPGQLLIEHPANGSWLNLGPLLLVEKASADSAERFLFYNGSKSGVSFLDYETGEHHDFPPEHIRALAIARAYPRSQVGPQWFVPLITDRTKYFVGRSDALAKLGEFSDGKGKRVLVVVAPPGLGKTTLLARWAEREPMLRHFLRENDEQSCAPSAIFANLARQAATAFNIPLRSAKDNESKKWKDELFRLLEAVPAEKAAPLVILDGLDEAERVRKRRSSRESILDWLPEPIQMPGRSRWVFSTRQELLLDRRFAERFSADNAEHLDLHRLDEAEVEAFLRTSGQWDMLQTEPLWVNEIVKRSEGSPLYLRLLIEELRAGMLTPGDPDVLPVGLAAFFERILHSVEEASRTGERQLVRAQKSNAGELIRRLVERGLISREASEALYEEERERLDARIGATGLEVLALIAIERAPLATNDISSILDCPRDELERILPPLRMVMVEDGEDRWTLFHGAFRDFIGRTRGRSIALASERIRKWGLRYREHRHPYALRHIVAHLTDGLEPAPEGQQPRREADNLVQVMTDLDFIALRASQNDVPGLLADYDLALNFWRQPSREPSASEPMPQMFEPWQREVVWDVLNGSFERYPDYGSGPAIAALRERAEQEPRPDQGLYVEQTPYFPPEQTVPEEWFPASRPPAAAAASTSSTTVAVMEEFAAFVSASAHQMMAGANVPALAFNFSASGAVADAAATMLRTCGQPWVERKNRPLSRAGIRVDVRVLPSAESVCVCPDFSRFVSLSTIRAGNVTGVEARLFELRTGGELAVLRSSGTASLQSQLPPASSTAGDCFVVGQIVVDFGRKHIFELPCGALRAAALTPDGRLLAVARHGDHLSKRTDYVSIWDLETHTRVRVLEQSDSEVHSLAISADGRLLAVGRHYGDLQIWDVARGKRLLTFAEGQHVRAVAMTPDGRFAVCGGSSGSVWMIDVPEARVLRQFHVASGRIDAVALTPDGRNVAARELSGLFSLWDVKTGTLAKTFDAPNPYRQLQLASNAAAAVAGNRVFNLGAALPDPTTRPVSVALNENAAAAVLGLKDGSLMHEVSGAARRDVIFRREQIDPDPLDEKPDILAVKLSADGRQAFVAYEDNEILLVNVEGGHKRVIPKAAWARLIAEELPKRERDAARLRGEDRFPRELRETLRLQRPAPKSYPISHLTLTPDAKILVTASHGDALRAWSVASGESVDTFPLTRRRSFGEGEVECLKPLPDSSGVVFTKFDGSFHLWRFLKGAKTSMRLRETPRAGALSAVTAVSGDGREAVWAMAGMPLEIRSTETGHLLRMSQRKVGHLRAVEWLRDGALLLSVSTDQEEAVLEIWDATSFDCMANYPLPSQAVEIAIAREGSRFICCTQDGQFHWLQYHPGEVQRSI